LTRLVVNISVEFDHFPHSSDRRECHKSACAI
jgi:hypothetical protein